MIRREPAPPEAVVPPLHPRLRELLDYLESSRTILGEAVESVPAGRRDAAPDATRWSVAAILEHLGIVERRITGLLTQQVQAARTAGVGPERSDAQVLPTIDLRRITDRSHRIRTTEASVPTAQMSWSDAWARLAETRAGLEAAIANANGLALGERTAPHPVLGNINLYEWIAFVGAHERRHAEQIREQGP